MHYRPWTDAELAQLQRDYLKVPTRAIAAALDRTAGAVYEMARRLGLADPRRALTPEMERGLRALVERGYCNRCAARELGTHRGTARAWRRWLGLPPVGTRGPSAACPSCRANFSAQAQRQVERLGLPSMGYLRVAAFQRFAREHGWPEDLPPRAVQMLEALWEKGPQTRRELADAIGMKWLGSRRSLKAKNTSYLAILITRGLVVKFPRLHRVAGQGRGYSCDVYALSITAQKETDYAAG